MPHAHHYHGIKHILKYLHATKNEGIIFWRTTSNEYLPAAYPPRICSNVHDLLLDGRLSHEPLRYHVLCEWVECDLLILSRVDTSTNMSDHFTKQLGPTLFHRHVDYIMGRVPPHYTQWFHKLFASTQWAGPTSNAPTSLQPIAAVAAQFYAHWLPVLTSVF